MTGPVDPPDKPIAVALSYEQGSAPVVTAAGSDELAATILAIARAHDVPIEKNPALAAALSNVELGQEIPEELYKAVATLIAFVLAHRPSRAADLSEGAKSAAANLSN